jgi:ribosome-associated heat shock protein Hsp15
VRHITRRLPRIIGHWYILGASCMSSFAGSLRIDRWLFYCRFFKTRSLATAAVTGGHVRINGERATPGSRIKCGDRIDMVRERLQYSLNVSNIPSRRGPAAEARNCYLEDEETVRQRDLQTAALRQDRLLMPKTDGRPDKHTRRKLRTRNRA